MRFRGISRRCAGLLTLCASAVALGLVPAAASADTSVAGSEYQVSFLGQGSAEVTETGFGNLSDVHSGTWTIQDNPASLWLPSTYDSNEEGNGSGSTTDSPYDAQTASDTADPASLSETQTSDSGSFTCSASAIYDYGLSSVSAEVDLGALTVSTTSASFFPRTFDVAGPFGGNYSTCSNGNVMHDFRYPPAGHLSGDGGTIAYAATVPFSDVGQGSFSLPATDQSTVNGAPYWNGFEGTHTFSVSGSYSFEKVCDGTIDYNPGGPPGTCAGGGSSGGAGDGQSPPPVVEPPQPPPPGSTGLRAAALKKCKKRAHRNHWSHKRLKKCRKRANQLPV